ncbi:hypothetical protein [Nocardia mexicana]|uniref:DUF8020 domain-containing protein n=1 Tax=Nocardia mexicana TaxID=279262 RepID=A0A370GSL9_9NOCA|nr:hypothetical protein [Nocardia mexicana]RDI46685.1 hypothetical protein DFR68_11090 [Nocardia mexicana]
MKFRSVTVAAAVVVGAMTTALGTAHADPVPDRHSIDYSAQLVDKTVVTGLTGGTFELVDKPGETRQFIGIRDSAGTMAVEFPLDFRVSGLPIPVRPVLRDGGRVLELTPEQPVGVQRLSTAQPVASPLENGRAINDFSSRLGVAAAIGALIGGAVAGAIGCVIAVLMLCVPGAVVFGAVGAVLGAVAGGGPAVIRDGVELMQTLQAPDGTTPWADRPGENPPS